MKKQVICLLAAALFLFSACGEKTPDNEGDGDRTSGDIISVSWNGAKGFDLINFGDDDNYAVARLVFDPLFEISAGYEAVPVLAESATLSENACVVNIKQGVQFHGGNTLTADDVVYTVNQHKNSENSPYRKRLENVTSVTAQSAYTVVFGLARPDGMFLQKLDFPIIRSGASQYTSEGTGRYSFRSENGSFYLKKNGNYYDAENTLVERINLISAGESSKVSLFNSGALTVMALRGNRFNTYIESCVSAGTFVSNKLTYIVPNTENKALLSPEVRKLISYAVNRTEILSNFSASNAFITYTAINPNWYLFDDSVITAPADADATFTALEYTKNSEGVYLELDILVHSAVYEEYIIAKAMTEELLEAGIKATVVSKDEEEYETALRRGNYDLRFDSGKVPFDMNVTALLGEFEDEFLPYTAALEAALDEKARESAASALLKQLDAKTPIIPLYFTTAEYIAKDDTRGKLSPIPSNPLYGIWGMVKKP